MNEGMSYADKPWLKNYKVLGLPTTLKPYPKVPLYDFLYDTARDCPNSPACTYMGKKFTYKEMVIDVNKLATALVNLGVKKGDKVATILPNSPQFVIGDYAIMKAGAANVPCSPLHKAADLEYELGEAGVETIICIDTSLDLVRSIVDTTEIKNIIITSVEDYSLEERLHHDEVPGTYQFMNLIKNTEVNPPSLDIDPEKDLAEVPFTGGATGMPKGVMLTHYNMACNVLQVFPGLLGGLGLTDAIKGNGAMLLPLPFFHQYGHWAMHTAVYMGFNMLLVPDPRDTDMMIDLMKKYRPLMNIGVPTQFMRLASKELGRIGVLSASGSAALPPEVADKYEKEAGAPVTEGYGLTETSPVTHLNLSTITKLLGGKSVVSVVGRFSGILPPIIKITVPIVGGERLLRGATRFMPLLTNLSKRTGGKKSEKRASIGIPTVDTEIKLIDPETGKDVPVGDVGEMIIRGPQVMLGYWPTPGSGLVDGWLHTGDLVKMDEDGYFYLVDRTKDMINVSGLKVYSRVVDDVLFAHPSVEVAGAIGIPDPERPGSERIKAFIKLKEGHEGKVTEEEIRDFCKEKLPPYAVPKFVEFRDDLPLTVTEKIFKKELREEELKKMMEVQ